MDRSVVPFRGWHYERLADKIPSADGMLTTWMPRDVLHQLEGQNSWTGTLDGEPFVCAGTMLQWPGRHSAWAYMGENTASHMLWITREVLKNLSRVKGRIELNVRCDFPAGQRWAKMLGFEVETPVMKGFGPDGEDHVGFVRIN